MNLFQLLTFLVAGHETTSSTLSFALYFLLTNPETVIELQSELDRILGDDGEVTLENLEKMEYLTGGCCYMIIVVLTSDNVAAVLRETLRLAPVAFFRTVTPKEDVILVSSNDDSSEASAGADATPTEEHNPKRYLLKKGTTVVVNTPSMQRDPRVWGADAEEFRPERLLDGRFAALPVRHSFLLLVLSNANYLAWLFSEECLAAIRVWGAGLHRTFNLLILDIDNFLIYYISCTAR